MSAYRHTRQVRLAEIGERGQARIARAAIAVRSAGPAGELEARYLAGAGVGTIRVSDDAQARAAQAVDASVRIERRPEDAARAPADRTPLDALDGLDVAALDVARAAYFALDALRRALAGSDRPEAS